MQIEFRDPSAHLELSPLHRAAVLTLQYLVDTGPIGLTPNYAMKRYFVTWAAEAFQWPGYLPEDLYSINKVLNEHDFPPLYALHDLLLSAKLVRRRKGFLHITKFGKDLLAHPGSLWIALAQHLLGHDDMLDVEWVSVLSAVNVEAHEGVSQTDFCRRLMGVEEGDYHLRSLIDVHVLLPLCWLGLLHEAGDRRSERFFTKTALWPVALTFEDQPPLPQVTTH